MIVLKILLLFLFCNNLISLKAQMNKCITPEGNEGFCMNIWECNTRVKYVFSNIQNFKQAFNTLKSVCDFTNSTIKLCCLLSSNIRNNIFSQKQIDMSKTNTTCNKNDSSEETIAELNDNLELNESENNIESVIFENEQYDDTSSEIILINGHIHENSATESEELRESSNINSKINYEKLKDSSSANNEEIEYDHDSHSIGVTARNLPAELNISIGSNNQINNNTFIIINMRDKSTILNNNNNSKLSDNHEDKNDNTTNSTTNNSDKISIDLFEKILCMLLGKNYSLPTIRQNNNDKSLENNPSIFDGSVNTKNISEASISLENINSLENSSYQKSTEIINSTSYETKIKSFDSSENNSSLHESIEMINYTESSYSQNQIDNSTENDADLSSLLSNESEDVFQYISLPNPPHCGKNIKNSSKKGEYSWQVLLKEKDKKFTKDFCRGTLITRQHIVTSAYCIRNREIESVLIHSQKISAYITLKIKDIRVHEHFEQNHTQNNIALIKLFGPIHLEDVSPICLKVDSHLTKNLTGVNAYSPGYVKNTDEPSAKIVKLISRYECINKLNNNSFIDIDANVLCTKSKAVTENVCLGNEGNPLVIRGKSNGRTYYYQIGIVSGFNSCDTNISIFVNINRYLNWLLKNM